MPQAWRRGHRAQRRAQVYECLFKSMPAYVPKYALTYRKPGVAGIALNAAPRFLDSWQGEEEEWDETLWRLPRNRAPVDVAGALSLLAALQRCECQSTNTDT